MSTFTITSLLFISFVIGYFIGVRNATKVIANLIKNGMMDKDLVPFCVAEYEQGNFYLYEKDTNCFLCQGKTLDDVAFKLSTSKKKITLAFVFLNMNGKNESFWIINGKINPVNTNES